MKFIYAILFLCLLSLASCRNNKKAAGDLKIKTSKNVIKIKIPDTLNIFNSYRLSTLIDSVRYIKLEKTNDSKIGEISKIVSYKNNFYILDILMRSLLKFSSSGKFEKKIGKMGNKEGEFIHPVSFIIDDEKLVVYDESLSKILYYNLDGDFIKEVVLPYRFNDFEKFNDSYVLSIDRRYNPDYIRNYKLMYTSPDWEIQQRGVKYNANTEVKLASARRSLTKFKDSLVYNPSFGRSIYHVSDDGIQLRYVIDAGKRNLPSGFDKNLSVFDFIKKYETPTSNVMYIGSPVFETENHLVMTLNYNKKYVFFYYDKKSRHLLCNTSVINDLPALFNTPLAADLLGNTFLSVVNVHQIQNVSKSWKQYHMEKEIPAATLNFANSVKGSDNPVLMFFTLKHF